MATKKSNFPSPFVEVIEDINKTRCSMCGTIYDKKRGNFPVNVGTLYRATGYLPICNSCADIVYKKYYAQCGDVKHAIRQFCRALNIYYSDEIYEKSLQYTSDKSPIVKYLMRLKSTSKANFDYDDTLQDEGTQWSFTVQPEAKVVAKDEPVEEEETVPEEIEEPVPDEWVYKWGKDLSRHDYEWLERKYSEYLSAYPEGSEIDMGSKSLLVQICNTELEINNLRAEGKSTEKSTNTFNNLIKSMNWTPSQNRVEDTSAYDKTPLGVWIKRWENERPIPEPDEDFRDPDRVAKYIHVFFLGHLCKMMGLKNTYSRMYEEEMEKYTVKRPELLDEGDDESVEMYDEIFGAD